MIAYALLLVSCKDDSSSMELESTMDIPEVDVNNPHSTEKWELSEWNVFASKIKIVPLHFFYGSMAVPESGEKQVPVEMCGALNGEISEEQLKALNEFLQKEKELYEKAREAIYDFYNKSYQDYKRGWDFGRKLFGSGDLDDLDEVLPKIMVGNELDKLVRFGKIYVHPARQGNSRIGIECSCPWDEEHGLGVLILGDEVEEVGLAEVSYPCF
jgi:hypothetical protein